MSVAAENGRDETLGVGLFGGGSVGDHAPTEATAHQRRRSWCAARDGHADAVGCEAPAETRREGLGKRRRRREHGGVLGRVATAADDEATPTAPPAPPGVASARGLRRRSASRLELPRRRGRRVVGRWLGGIDGRRRRASPVPAGAVAVARGRRRRAAPTRGARELFVNGRTTALRPGPGATAGTHTAPWFCRSARATARRAVSLAAARRRSPARRALPRPPGGASQPVTSARLVPRRRASFELAPRGGRGGRGEAGAAARTQARWAGAGGPPLLRRLRFAESRGRGTARDTAARRCRAPRPGGGRPGRRRAVATAGKSRAPQQTTDSRASARASF